MGEHDVTCAFCKRTIDLREAWIGPTTGNPYCPDAMIHECLKTFGERVGMLDLTYQPQQVVSAAA